MPSIDLGRTLVVNSGGSFIVHSEAVGPVDQVPTWDPNTRIG